jgi:hypothetical protein
MRFTNFKTIKLATAPGTGDNPIPIKLRRILLIIRLLRITNRLSLKA